MEIGAFFLLLAIVIIVVIFIAQPYIDERKHKTLVTEAIPAREKETHISALYAERDRLILALQELEFDYQLGKIPDEDYPGQRNYLLQKGVQVIKKLDEIGGVQHEGDQEARIVSVIRERQSVEKKQSGRIVKDADIEAMIASRRRMKATTPDSFCTQCGNPISNTDKFCSRCGNTV